MSFKNALKFLSAHPLIDAAIQKEAYVPLDLSLHNNDLKGVDVSSSKDLEAYIWKYLEQNNARVAYGGYLERRGIYRRSSYFNEENKKSERNIHLGLDVWIEEDTPIYAPLDGTIHSFKNNTNFGDYGPTIILYHEFDNIQFYTLYGHLSVESIEGISIGSFIKRGQQIATLGVSDINGDYPPHLHFQIIKDIGDYHGDYPGVCSNSELQAYKENCPDPNWLLKL
ncbi:peptidoglycan DD-metalloendopeptidase family protein [Winogradskyella aurantia]|uniref:Peptidase M23 n=1 Tax=Winogradskyella aurantia TaxID=1915063 RepID=A0A265UQG9_9FLAO|nr:peptidoglycan DD-metalloendopeptidase family protein [Winogradskyella aurantia]OZV67564.1 peptidase M23 [Winogradskyella aurantia]